MKKQILFKSALSLVAAVAAGSAFAALPYNEDFESPWQEGDLITTDSQWAAGEGDASAIALGNGGQVLELKTEGATLTNTLVSADATEANGAITGGDKAVFEAEVKFVPSDNLDCGVTGGTDDTKFAIYAYAPDSGEYAGTTNLVVYHAYNPGSGVLYTNEVIEVNGALDNADNFAKVTVKMFKAPVAQDGLFFTVALGEGAQAQQLETSIVDIYNDPQYEDSYPKTWFKTVNSGAGTALSAICFKGTGMVDNLGVSTESAVATQITVTLNDGGFTATGLKVDGTDVSPIPATIDVDEGAIVEFTVANDDGATKKIEIEASSSVNAIDFTGATFGWPEYLGDVVSGAYQIDDANDLDMLRKGVAAGLTTSGETFKQTADIDMTSAGAFAGIGSYSKVPTAGTPFLGTYDGQNFTIANVQRAGENTQGIFNQVGPSGVIENLVVSNMYWDSELSGEYGFAIVGNAGGGATLRNLTAAGTFGSATKPSSHNIAGIAVRLSPGATAGAATTVDSCTNNATIYGAYTKLGGINAIVQDQTGFKDGKVVFVNCANNGTLVCKRTAADVTGTAGIVAYFSGTNVELTGCYSNGNITNADGANTDKDGALVGWTYGGTIKDNGGNSAPANKKMIGTWGSATETGFLYATVDNGVATTVASIAAGGDYLLEGNATPVITLQANESVAFDTALGYTLTTNSIAAASGLELQVTSSGTKTTYTAAAPAPAGFDGGDGVTTFSIAAATQTALEGNLPEGVASLEAIADADSNLTYAQAYALGLWDENASEVAPLNAEITFDNQGRPQVELDADNAVASYDITCKLYGSTSLPVSTSGTVLAEGAPGTALVDTTASSDTTKFYKVVIVISDKQ